ncbi:excinuclease ABC subunit C [candidate division WOR-3 bacterium]|uniref:UvrABC system protein C n=1 Tax=candidate division WOR-3 bacterium TaxID=2052148 RepID=A0A660SJG6_UNCW3|nr:MAG: excinuclease ABC subunit C [candidate division WOR-3 bacterium]
MRGEIEAKIRNAPSLPGVYIFKGKTERPLYIGKAADLNKRLRSYLQPTDPKSRRILNSAVDLEYIVTNSDTEALTLEESLIKLNRPRYNIRLKDDKKYPYLKLTIQDKFPRLYLTRNLKKDGSLIFGPYTSARSLRETIRTVTRIFRLRSCRKRLPLKTLERPCLNFYMKRCLAPCQGNIGEEEYRTIVDEVIQFLKGKSDQLEARIERLMLAAAEKEQFELAARYRDQLRALRTVKRRQQIITADGIDRDVIGIATAPKLAVAVIFKIRDNHLLGKETYRFEKDPTTEPEEIGASILRMIYTHLSFLPDEIVVRTRSEDASLFERWAWEYRRQKVVVRTNPKWERKNLLEWATKNAGLALSEELARRPLPKPLIDLMQHLNLPRPPCWIEAFDVSNLKGKEATGSSVAFINGRPKKSLYRRYRIRSVDGIDDYAMIREVIHRRLKDLGRELPDLLLIDGGRGQLSAAITAMKETEIEIPVLAFAKRFDQLFFPDGRVVSIPPTSPALHLLKRVRDEAHRFAITYHRKLRRKKLRRMSLEALPGIGPKRALILYRYFQDIETLKRASEEELRSIPGIGKELARSIYEALHS